MQQYFLIHEEMPEELVSALSLYGTCIRLPAFDALPEPVCRHPDMLIVQIGGYFITHRDYRAGQRILRDLGVDYRLSDAPVGSLYPADVALNAWVAGGCLFASARAVSPAVLEAAKHAGLLFVPVSQGYAKCSAAVLQNTVITADTGIFHAACSHGLDALQMQPGGIGIERYDTGFIGGACGALDANTLGFFGNLMTHPDGEKMACFLQSHGIRAISLGAGKLFDYGGVVAIFTEKLK